jgi:hypothetical protein
MREQIGGMELRKEVEEMTGAYILARRKSQLLPERRGIKILIRSQESAVERPGQMSIIIHDVSPAYV